MVNGILDDRRGEGGRERRDGDRWVVGRERGRGKYWEVYQAGNPSFPPSNLLSALPCRRSLPPHERFQYPVMSVAQCTHCKVRPLTSPRLGGRQTLSGAPSVGASCTPTSSLPHPFSPPEENDGVLILRKPWRARCRAPSLHTSFLFPFASFLASIPHIRDPADRPLEKSNHFRRCQCPPRHPSLLHPSPLCAAPDIRAK